MKTVNNIKHYKNANKCGRCPGNNTEKGCPWWWEYVRCNTKGEEHLVKQCGKTVMPEFLVAVIAASNRPAETISQMRNDICKRVEDFGEAVMKLQHLPQGKDDG